MIEHPVPRQITTFEFKLIGELTIKQFGFLLFGSIIAIIVYFIVPAFAFLNFFAAAVPALLGIGFAFFPINERPLDIWLKNLINRLFSATQYYYQKKNLPPKILMGLTLPSKEILQQHVLAKQKLDSYLQTKTERKTNDQKNEDLVDNNKAKKEGIKKMIFEINQTQKLTNVQTTNIKSIPQISIETENLNSKGPALIPDKPLINGQEMTSQPTNIKKLNLPKNPEIRHFTLSGAVYSTSGIPLANILLYLKQTGNTIRLFKTNRDGTFVNNLPITVGEYVLEAIDPRNKYGFDRIIIDGSKTSIEIFASSQK